MNHLANRKQCHVDRQEAEALRLEDAKARFKSELLYSWPVPIYSPGEHGMSGVSDEYAHKDALIEWDAPGLWTALRTLHWELVHASGGQPTKQTLDAVRTAMNDALEEAAERCAPMMLAAEDKKVAEWNESLREPLDQEFFRRAI